MSNDSADMPSLTPAAPPDAALSATQKSGTQTKFYLFLLMLAGASVALVVGMVIFVVLTGGDQKPEDELRAELLTLLDVEYGAGVVTLSTLQTLSQNPLVVQAEFETTWGGRTLPHEYVYVFLDQGEVRELTLEQWEHYQEFDTAIEAFHRQGVGEALSEFE